jgi:hypothetical protein
MYLIRYFSLEYKKEFKLVIKQSYMQCFYGHFMNGSTYDVFPPCFIFSLLIMMAMLYLHHDGISSQMMPHNRLVGLVHPT